MLQLDFGFAPRPKLLLADIQEYMKHNRVLGKQAPCRETIIGWIEEGTLEGFQTPKGWVVYQDSFKHFITALDKGDSTIFKRFKIEAVAA